MSELKKQETEEIDLFTFLKPIGKTIMSFFRGIGIYLGLLYQHLVLLIAFVVVFGIMGFSLRFILPGLYKSEAIFSSHEIPAKLCVLMLNNLQEMSAAKKNKSVLAGNMNISQEQAVTVSSIEAALMKDSFFVNDKDTVRNMFSVIVKSSNPVFLANIQTGIVHFLASNEFARVRTEGKRKMMLELKESLLLKVKGLDSLKQIVNSSIVPRSTGQGIILGEPISPVSVYQTEINFYRELIEIDRILSVPDNVEVVQPFIVTIRPNYPRFNLIMLYFIASGLLLAMIIIPFKRRK
jgi:hypothetical protein